MAKILGISAYYHDSAACLVVDGDIVAAAQEERFTRKKHDYNFPSQAIEYCLGRAGIAAANELDYVVFYDKPFVKFERLLETYGAYAPLGLTSFLKAMPLWLKQKLWTRDNIADDLDYDGKVLFTEHHESHAASAFFPSPFERSAILTLTEKRPFLGSLNGHPRPSPADGDFESRDSSLLRSWRRGALVT